MKLVIMRHAKSSWGSANQSDHDRPLNERGRTAAPEVARRLEELGHAPTHIVASDSERTTETAILVAASLSDSPEIRYFPSLYLAGATELASALESLPDDCECALALGHNPGWEQCAAKWGGVERSLKTADAVVLAGDGKWSDAAAAAWREIGFVRAREC